MLQPLVIIFGCLLFAVITKSEKWRNRLLIGALVLFSFFGNEFIINEIFLRWETRAGPFTEIDQVYDVAIILGGVVITEQKPDDRTHFTKGVDRVLHPYYLYKSGKIKNFLISGGTGRLLQNTPKEAPQIKKSLIEMGVPASKIFIEEESRNTYENALYSKEILDQHFKSGKFLLVTSAFHLPRAVGCFTKQGIDFDVLSTDFYATPRRFTPDVLLIPNSFSFIKWRIILKEWVGLASYKLAGYL